MNASIAELLIIGALSTVIQFLPLFIKNPNSQASARLRHYVDLAITELTQFRDAIPGGTGSGTTKTIAGETDPDTLGG